MPTTSQDEKEILEENRRENLIFSSLLYDSECREYGINKRINPEYFTNEAIKGFLQLFNSIAESPNPLTVNTLIEHRFPHDEQEAERVKLKNRFEKLKKHCPPLELNDFIFHMNVIKKKNKVKRLRELGLKLIELVNKEEENITNIKDKNVESYIQESLAQIGDEFNDEEIKSMNLSEGIHFLIRRINEARNNEEISDTITTGYPELDAVLSGGYRKGNFSIIAARPSMGKTVVMLAQAVEAAKAGAKVLIVSIEMNLLQCFQRIVSNISQVSARKIQQPRELNPSELEKLDECEKAIADLYGQNLFIEEAVNISVPELHQRIKMYKKKYGVDLVFVDYAQIMKTNTGKAPEEASDYAQISQGLMAMAKILDVAVVVGSQLTRDVEKRQDKRPMLSDLRNSGAFEQDAAAVIGLYRDVVYNKESDKPNTIEFVICKNRFGQGNVIIPFEYDFDRQMIMTSANGEIIDAA